jgi:hypothetical protein
MANSRVQGDYKEICSKWLQANFCCCIWQLCATLEFRGHKLIFAATFGNFMLQSTFPAALLQSTSPAALLQWQPGVISIWPQFDFKVISIYFLQLQVATSMPQSTSWLTSR